MLYKRGKFIVIDGGEGSGKSTCIETVKRKFGDAFLYTREPGGTPLGERIRNIVLSDEYKMDIRTELLLFFASRAEHVANVIYPALVAGKNVLCDRFDHSTIAYQIFGKINTDFLHTAKTINTFAKNGIEPDLRILLDVDAETGLRRVANRREDRTVFDNMDIDFHYRVNSALYALAMDCAGNSIVVSANSSQDVVVACVLEAIEKILKKE